jgi:hypothetical protein
MTHDPLDAVTARLRTGVADTGDVGAAPEGRDAAIVKLREALDRRAARLRWRRRGAWMVAAAGVAAGTWALGFRTDKPSTSNLGRVHSPEGVPAVVDGQAVALGAGSRVSEGTELRDERFVVATPDAEVEVRGTAFRVAIVPPDPGCGGGTPTRLEVTEGVVTLRHAGVALAVSAGTKWPASCPAGPVASVGATASAAPVTATADDAGAATSVPAPVPSSSWPSDVAPRPRSPSGESSLSEQNDLFDAAMHDKRAGRTANALAALEQLRSRYPTGPLAETSEAERMRLLTGAAKSRAARDYLERWPRGFARAEAETLAGAP